MAAGSNGKLTEQATAALRDLEKCNGFHDNLVSQTEARWRAFEGHLEDKSDAAQWQSRLHPPFLNHIVETTVAGLLEDRFAYSITPKPRFYNDEEEFLAAKHGAKAHDILFRSQLAADRFNEFQRPFVLQAAVARFSIAKTYWRKDEAPRTRLEQYNAGEHLGMNIPALRKTTSTVPVFDGPVTECVDIRDFYWHEAATSLDKSRWVAHAVWMSMDDIRRQAKQGRFDQAAVDILNTPDSGAMDSDVERDREKRARKKDMVEVLEIWSRETGRVITLGARKVVLRDKPWPFWELATRGEYPFVVGSLQPFPFSVQGMSIVEKLMHLQEATWDLMNQRHDNLRFLNNWISIIRSDVDDPDAFPFEPGAVWFMEDPTAVTQWHPDATPSQVSLPAEAGLKQDMQNLAGGHPFTSTSEANTVGANTATEAALVTNLAQQAEKAMKQQLYYSYERIGCQRMYLNQQFIREPIYVNTIGLDDQQEVREVLPHLLQGEYDYSIAPMSESLMRAEKRSEATGLFQVLIGSAPVLAAVGVQMNYQKLVENVLEQYDIADVDAYFSHQPTPQIQAGPQQQQGAPGQQPGPGGVTAPQSIDPAVSPSAQSSVAPSQFMARTLARTGGVNNT